MLATTLDILKSGLRADPTVSPAERARLLALLRQGPEVPRPDAPPSSIDRILRRREAVTFWERSLRFVDRLAKDGILRRRLLPGRKRASGFLASDVMALIAGKAAE